MALFASTGNSTRDVSDISPGRALPMVGSWCDCLFSAFSQVCEVTTSGTEVQPGEFDAARCGQRRNALDGLVAMSDRAAAVTPCLEGFGSRFGHALSYSFAVFVEPDSFGGLTASTRQ